MAIRNSEFTPSNEPLSKLGPQGRKLQCSQKGFEALFFCWGGGGQTGNRRLRAASRPNPAPGGGLGKAPAGARSSCIDVERGRSILRPLREVLFNPLVTALEKIGPPVPRAGGTSFRMDVSSGLGSQKDDL